MMATEQTKQLLGKAANVAIVCNQDEPAAVSAALALFYTLREAGKNVNLMIDRVPETISFLIPSAEFLQTPRNFVLSIPRTAAEVSQIYYEKSEERLNIHLTLAHGRMKKEQIDFYAQEPKPDAIIALGIKNFKREMEQRLNEFGFLLTAPIINIDTATGNEKYGTENLVEPSSLAEISLDLLKDINEPKITKAAAECLMAALIIAYDNFQRETAGERAFD
ncbi:MAG: hypothetical protein ACREHG_06515, partial [Candidatus Saccharimonadales bacterium]